MILGKPRTTGRRWLRGLVVTIAVLATILLIAYGVIMKVTSINPPSPSASDVAGELPVEAHGARAAVGPNWLSRERGIWELHLEGEPYAMGWAHARLASRLFAEAEGFMFSEMHRYVPSKIALFFIRVGVRLKFRHLPDFIPPDRMLEMAGEARAVVDGHGDFLPLFHRLVFYHALHDITQGLEHSPLLGCSAFAASGAATASGHLIIGRNFDFEGPEPFDKDKIVLFFKPKGKIPFASVAWAGMTGVVTGMNAEGIYISINAARSDDKGKDGIPVELLLREVMEGARSLDEAIAILRAHEVMVPDFYLIGDGKTGEAAVVERTPARMEVRRSRDTLISTNHAVAPAFAKDVENDRLRRYTTSDARLKRMTELVHQSRGALDPRRALEILRDKKGQGGEPLGLGNRNTLDAIIATHSVVVDATTLTMWVGVGPHCLGRYVGFDLRKELLGEDRPPPIDLPADPILDGGDLRDFRQSLAELSYAEALDKQGEHARAIEAATRAEAIAEKLPEPHKLLGDLLRAGGRPEDKERARTEYRRFLELSPPYLRDIESVKGILESL